MARSWPALMAMIDTKLLYADCLRTVPPENQPNIEENLRQPFEKHEMPKLMKMVQAKDRAELAEKLQEKGTSLDDLRRQFNERTIASQWLREKTPKPEQLTHEQMLDYYQQNLEEYEFPAQVRWEELMVRFDRMGGDRSKAWKEIAEMGNEVWQQVAQQPNMRGEVFAKVAKARSHGVTANDGGVHEWTSRGALKWEKVDQALFGLEIGQMSNILESDLGFHIVRPLQRKDAGRRPFTEAQVDIRKALERDLEKDLIQNELAELRKQSRVWTIFDGKLTAERIREAAERKRRSRR